MKLADYYFYMHFGYLFNTFNTLLPTGGKIFTISLNEEKVLISTQVTDCNATNNSTTLPSDLDYHFTPQIIIIYV